MSSWKCQDDQTILPNTSAETSKSQEDKGDKEELDKKTYGEPVPDHHERVTYFVYLLMIKINQLIFLL